MSSPTELACPSCARALKPMPLRGVVVDRCIGCGGLWFDGGELAKAARGSLPMMSPLGVSRRSCPRCRAVMQLGRASSVELERCAQCKGVYLDAGEFVNLVPISSDALRGKAPRTSDGSARPSRQLDYLTRENPEIYLAGLAIELLVKGAVKLAATMGERPTEPPDTSEDPVPPS